MNQAVHAFPEPTDDYARNCQIPARPSTGAR